MSFSKRGTLRILIVGISFLVTLFISEVVARSAPDVFGADRKRLEEFRMFIADGVASFVPRPHTVYGNNPKKSAINSLGYRGEEWSLEKPTPSTLRILCMGGSTPAGMFPPGGGSMSHTQEKLSCTIWAVTSESHSHRSAVVASHTESHRWCESHR